LNLENSSLFFKIAPIIPLFFRALAPKKSDLACAKNAINFLEKNAEKR